MNIHKNARLTPVRREEMALAVIDGRLSRAQAAVFLSLIQHADCSSKGRAL